MPKYPEDVDSLGVIGIIISKDYEDRYPEGKDSTEIIFDIKVLEVSRDDIWVFGKTLKQMDTMQLHVTSYGRLIDKY